MVVVRTVVWNSHPAKDETQESATEQEEGERYADGPARAASMRPSRGSKDTKPSQSGLAKRATVAPTAHTSIATLAPWNDAAVSALGPSMKFSTTGAWPRITCAGRPNRAPARQKTPYGSARRTEPRCDTRPIVFRRRAAVDQRRVSDGQEHRITLLIPNDESIGNCYLRHGHQESGRRSPLTRPSVSTGLAARVGTPTIASNARFLTTECGSATRPSRPADPDTVHPETFGRGDIGEDERRE